MKTLLASDHAALNESLNEFFAALDAANLEECHARLDLFWARLAMHIRAEHLHLFPAILRALRERTESESDCPPSLNEAVSAIERLRGDHDSFMRELSGLIRLLNGLIKTGQQSLTRESEALRAGVVEVSERLAAHNEFEEDQVYRWAEELIPSSEQTRLDARLKNELVKMPRRFQGNS